MNNNLCVNRENRIQNGKVYDNNYSRAAAYFLGTCAPYPKGIERQAAYQLITGIYSLIFTDATQIGYKTTPDVYFEPWEKQNGRENDVKAIRDAIARIQDIVKHLFHLVDIGEYDGDCLVLPQDVKIQNRGLLKTLDKLEVKILNGNPVKIYFSQPCITGLKELCQISKKNTIVTDEQNEENSWLYFSRCVFEPQDNWLEVAFDNLLNAEGRLIGLCKELEKQGYRRVNCRDGKRITLDYVKLRDKKPQPLKMSWADKYHSGIEVTYEELRLKPCFFWIRAPYFKTVLENIDQLSENVVTFISDNIKTCDNCRYCVQTDKTKTRPLANMKVGTKRKCPLYPSLTMNWRVLSQDLVDGTLSFLNAIDNINF